MKNDGRLRDKTRCSERIINWVCPASSGWCLSCAVERLHQVQSGGVRQAIYVCQSTGLHLGGLDMVRTQSHGPHPKWVNKMVSPALDSRTPPQRPFFCSWEGPNPGAEQREGSLWICNKLSNYYSNVSLKTTLWWHKSKITVLSSGESKYLQQTVQMPRFFPYDAWNIRPAGWLTGRVRGSPKPAGGILLGPWMSKCSTSREVLYSVTEILLPGGRVPSLAWSLAQPIPLVDEISLKRYQFWLWTLKQGGGSV